MDMGFTGTAKYGEGGFAEASIDKIMSLFDGMQFSAAADGHDAQVTLGRGE